MSEINEKELMEAAQRCFDGGFDTEFVTSKDYYKSELHAKDTDAISRFVINELLRRQEERAEREKPIDAEWLWSISSRCPFSERWRVLIHRVYGESEYKTQLRARICDNGKCLVMIEQGGEKDCDDIEAEEDVVSFGHDIATRGQLLDLMNALKCERSS